MSVMNMYTILAYYKFLYCVNFIFTCMYIFDKINFSSYSLTISSIAVIYDLDDNIFAIRTKFEVGK